MASGPDREKLQQRAALVGTIARGATIALGVSIGVPLGLYRAMAGRPRYHACMEPVAYIERLTRLYDGLGYPRYNWVHSQDDPPWAELRKPLAESRLGLVASGGIYASGQVAFHYKDDVSIRAIPREIRTDDLRTAHFAYDQTDSRRDPNVVFPIDTLRGLVSEGVVGELADHAFTFMGGIYSSRRVREEVAPEILRRLQAEHVDALLLVPV